MLHVAGLEVSVARARDTEVLVMTAIAKIEEIFISLDLHRVSMMNLSVL
jgi:hypothetical protein